MMKKWLAILLALLCLTASASASFDHLYTDSVTLCPHPSEGVSKYIFVRTHSNWLSSKTVSLNFDKGQMHVEFRYRDTTVEGLANVYPSAEAKIWYWDVQLQRWVKEQQFDIYCKSEHDIELEKEDTYYCIQLYFWKPTTVATSYDKHKKFPANIVIGAREEVVRASWLSYKLPTVTVEPGFDMNMYKDNPMYFLPSE